VRHTLHIVLLISILVALAGSVALAKDPPIPHDAEYYILEAQNSEKWAADDKAVDAKLAAFREKNGGAPPNILYILIDDIGFGDMGIPELNKVRGYSTPHINKFAKQGMRMVRMYTEPSCTPTRVAFSTGRQPYRNGMSETSVDISGFGLAAKEVTLAEVLSDVGYNTVHIGKWHMGDIMESWPTHQGFDYASFPIHQQGQLAIFHDDGAAEEVAIGMGERNYDSKFTKDRWFRPDASHMATVVEGKRGETVKEVHMKPGERWTQKKYEEMNARFQRQTLEHLRDLAKKDKPFFLQYWPLVPLSPVRTTVSQFSTPNGGTFAESMQELDAWIGEILTEVDKLGIADNTLVVVMGDNGHFTKYAPGSGFSPMIYRGGKTDTSEGGVRVDAFVRWPGLVEGGAMVNDIVHIADLFTSIARVAGATSKIPRDRVIDGVDQTALLLEGETHGRRDHIFIYSGNHMKAVVKEQFKLEIPGPGENAIVANFYDLFRDPREEMPVSTEVGAWAGGEFVRMMGRHYQRKKMYPDVGPAFGRPYDGIENLRPETKAAVEAFLIKQNSPKK